MYSVKEVSELCGITIRTLHYYDEIGLLTPQKDPRNNYRFYSDEDILRLQEILFFREMEFSLKEINAILNRSDYDRCWILSRQRNLILQKRDHYNSIIGMIDTILEDKFMTQNMNKEDYAKEAKERWGDTDAYREYEATQKDTDKEKNEAILRKAEEIFADFASFRDVDPADDRVQALVARWQGHLTEHYYECTKDILSCLGQMYTADERFSKYLDRFGLGTAEYMSKAIAIYCK